MSSPYPWIKDSKDVTSSVTGCLAVTSPNGLCMVDPNNSSRFITFDFDKISVNGTLMNWSTIVGQNTASSLSGLPPTISITTNQTLTVNFNNSFSSVTRYLVNFTTTTTTTQTINTYTLSGGVTGGQYTLVIQLVAGGTGTTTWTFNGTGLASTQKSNFATITTGAMTTGTTKYVVLTFAYDGTNYFISGSNFA